MIVPPCCMGCSPSSCQESLLHSLAFLSHSSHPFKVSFWGKRFHNGLFCFLSCKLHTLAFLSQPSHPLKVFLGKCFHNVLFCFSSCKLHRLTFLSQSSHPLKVFLGKCFHNYPFALKSHEMLHYVAELLQAVCSWCIYCWSSWTLMYHHWGTWYKWFINRHWCVQISWVIGQCSGCDTTNLETGIGFLIGWDHECFSNTWRQPVVSSALLHSVSLW